MDNNLFVIDNSEIIIFDQFGNGIGYTGGDNNFQGIRIIFNNLIANTDEKVFHADLRFPELKLSQLDLVGLQESAKIISALMFKNKLYLLTKNQIMIFNRF
jgi:hypothetical protein